MMLALIWKRNSYEGLIFFRMVPNNAPSPHPRYKKKSRIEKTLLKLSWSESVFLDILSLQDNDPTKIFSLKQMNIL